MSKRTAAAQRRNRLLLMLTFMIASAAVWFLLIEGPRSTLLQRQKARSDAQTALTKARKQVNDATRVKSALEADQRRLEEIETKIPIGDPYRWLVKAFGEFPAASRVTIANIDAPHVSESTIYPKVPYKSATFVLNGAGYYHDFGLFLADLENEFPHMRVRRLELSPAYPGTADSPEAEKLNFQLELMILFKSAAPSTPTQLSQANTSERKN